MERERRSIEDLKQILTATCAEIIEESVLELGDLILTVKASNLTELLRLCRDSKELSFNLLVDITAVDWLDSREVRFEVVYQLLSLANLWRLTIKVALSEDSPEIATATTLWAGANFLEREVWDMFGIRFTGHPDLRRILMYDEFIGHPLRKDYPVQGKQPRIALRMPEVENTSRRMQRPELVSIRKSKASAPKSQSAEGSRE